MNIFASMNIFATRPIETLQYIVISKIYIGVYEFLKIV